MRIREVQNLLTNKGFNPYIDIENPDLVFYHLIEEVGELAHALLTAKTTEEIRDELGDIFILLCFYSSSIRIDLQRAVYDKITKNIQKGKFGLKEYKKETLQNLDKLFKE